MSCISRIIKLSLVLVLVHLASACAPKVGSAEWCKSIEEKPNGELTLSEAKDYAKHCVFKK